MPVIPGKCLYYFVTRLAGYSSPAPRCRFRPMNEPSALRSAHTKLSSQSSRRDSSTHPRCHFASESQKKHKNTERGSSTSLSSPLDFRLSRFPSRSSTTRLAALIRSGYDTGCVTPRRRTDCLSIARGPFTTTDRFTLRLRSSLDRPLPLCARLSVPWRTYRRVPSPSDLRRHLPRRQFALQCQSIRRALPTESPDPHALLEYVIVRFVYRRAAAHSFAAGFFCSKNLAFAPPIIGKGIAVGGWRLNGFRYAVLCSLVISER